jgi:hypothetical protein
MFLQEINYFLLFFLLIVANLNKDSKNLIFFLYILILFPKRAKILMIIMIKIMIIIYIIMILTLISFLKLLNASLILNSKV